MKGTVFLGKIIYSNNESNVLELVRKQIIVVPWELEDKINVDSTCILRGSFLESFWYQIINIEFEVTS